VAAFLASEADCEFRPVTIARRAAAIAAAHRAQDHPNPCDSGAVAAVLSGIRRELGTAPTRRAAPLDLDPLARLLDPIDTTMLAGLRDRALLLLGFAAALRRAELVALDVEDLTFDVDRGLLVAIRASKTDQERAGAVVAVPYARAGNHLCAVRTLHTYLDAASIHDGPVFRRLRRGDTPHRPAAHRPVGRADHQAPRPRGRRPPAQLSGHSLRAGYATAAAAARVEERKIASVTRYKNLPVLRRYIRTATAFDDVGDVL
jgi:integrase